VKNLKLKEYDLKAPIEKDISTKSLILMIEGVENIYTQIENIIDFGFNLSNLDIRKKWMDKGNDGG